MLRRSLLLMLAVAAAAMVLAQPAGACIKRHEVSIAKGASPSGWGWSVKGSIGPNGGNCREWLFGMEFNLEGVASWGSSTGIPPGRSYGGHPEVEADDDLLRDGSDRAFIGFVGGEVTKVLVTLSNNKHLVIHPKLPRPKLRRHVVWLRDVRYFARFYRPEAFVTGVASFDRAGLLVSRDKTFDGF